MPNIVIAEIDETKPGVISESTDVVYIPGLVNLDQDSLYEDASRTDGPVFTRGDYKGLGFRQPQLFTSVSDFVTMCGEKPYKFSTDVKYDGLGNSFTENATPVEGIMIGAGVSDPAYVMAKELLAAGLCVVYERINYYNHSTSGYDSTKDGSYTKVDTEVPEADLSDYYYESTVGGNKVFISYNSVCDTAPTVATGTTIYSLTKVNEEPSDFSTAKYYKLNTNSNELIEYPEGAEFDANFTYSINETGVTTPVSGFASNYENYAFLDDGTYIRFSKVMKPYDSNNCWRFNSNLSIKAIYEQLEDVFSVGDTIVDGIIDKGNYSIKYLTTGGYPVYEYNQNSIVTKMLNFAEKRGDCVALIDHTDNKSRTLNPFRDDSLYKAVVADSDTVFKANGDFGAMFTPWATYNRTTDDGTITEDGVQVSYSDTSFRAPASFAYLAALADSIKTNANWLAIAGSTRGGVLNLASGGMDTQISNGAANEMQPRNRIAINPITNIKPYGNTIWGNRTLKKNVDNLVATSFLNIRNLVSDVKKTCYRTARAMTFEQDTDILWINFKAEISKLLNRMVSGYGISGYKIIKDTSHKFYGEKGTICAKVILYPTYAVEDFYITIVLKDDEVTVE